MDDKTRCFGDTPEYIKYHDEEWGVPVYDDKVLFEFIILEGAQAGLNWKTILKKREGYRELFYDFDVERVAKMTDEELEKLLENPKIIRNRLKVNSARKNAKVFIDIQREYGSFANFLWGYVDNKQIINHNKTGADIPVTSELSDRLSKELKKRGMSFVGSTIIYSYLQAVGVIDDHIEECHCRKNKKEHKNG